MTRAATTLVALLFVACGRSSVKLDTQTFALRYLHPSEARDIVSPYVFVERPGAPGALSVTDNALTVRETRDNLERIARMLSQFDRPRPLVRLTFHLI